MKQENEAASKRADRNRFSIKPDGGARVAKIGGYAALMSVISILVAIAINLFLSELPAQYIKFDTSSQKLYTISPQTKEVLAGLDQDVTLYYVALQGTNDLPVEELLKRYESLSNRVKVERIDPMLYPNFALQYTSESLVGNDVIVKIGDKSRLVSYSDIYDVVYSSDYTNTDIKYDTIFQGESALTNAISFLTKGNMPVVYNISGHGEVEIEPDLQRFVERQNIEMKPLNLVSEGIPSDANALILLSPKTDLSDPELKQLLDYLSGGGNLLLITDYIDKELKNIDALVKSYGLEKADGLLVDPSSGYSMSGYPMVLVPGILEHEITAPLLDSKYRVVAPVCHGIVETEAFRDTLIHIPILITSPYAYLKTDAISSEVLNLGKEDGDVEGVYSIGTVATEQHANHETKLVWIATSEFLKQNYDDVSSGANRDLFVNAIAWMCGHEDAVSIHAKTISTKYLSLTSGQSTSLTLLFLVVLPISVVAVGGIIWYRRKKS